MATKHTVFVAQQGCTHRNTQALWQRAEVQTRWGPTNERGTWTWDPKPSQVAICN